ncbi:AAA family ATPase [Streptomyces sp. NA04227]|nr:AAA family ATPase [Streptomyces sp. NA04227]
MRRARLLERLDEGVRRPLTLVSGAAGAGKTLLVADWAGTVTARNTVAWLSVEPEDTAPGVFWTYVLEALRRQAAVRYADLAGGFDDADSPDRFDDVGSPARSDKVDHSLLARLAALLNRRAEPVVLVLDEFDHVVSSAEIAEALHFVLRHAGGGLRLVITSRTEPLLPLHRYRAADEATDIRDRDLAFRPAETAELLRRHGIRLSGAGLDTVAERTGGWAAGLRLCILAAQRADDPESYLKGFEAGQSRLADFLLAEVLDAQPSETQDLLLRSSVLERVHPGLADALTGRADGAPVLAGLQRANAFVEAIGDSWYRLHPLFAEILRAHLRVRSPGLEPELHHRAARWLGGAGLVTEALPHAVDVADWELLAHRFVDDLALGRLLTGVDAARLDELFSRMPHAAAGPAPDLVRAARELARHNVGRGLGHLRRVRERLRADGSRASATVRLGCALLSVLAARMTGAADRAEAAAREMEAARRDLPEERLARHPELTALMLTDLGSAQLWAGRFEAARRSLVAAARVDVAPATAYPHHECLSRLALIDFLRGWPRRAEAHALEAVAQAERSGLQPAARTGLAELVRAAVAIDRDELVAAGAHLDRAAASAAAPHDPIVTAELPLLRSRLRLAQGDPRGALHALDVLEQPSPVVRRSPWVEDRIALATFTAHRAGGRREAAARVLHGGAAGPQTALAAAHAGLGDGEREEALRLLDSIPSEPGQGPKVTVATLLVRARAADALDDEYTAGRLVARALALARPERLRRPFLDAGPWLVRLMRRSPSLGQGHDWLPESVTGHPPRSTPGSREESVPTETLTPREHEVLCLLARLLSVEEIAAELHLSVNTVKTHLKNVYRKLAATRRNEAVRRARELDLL